VCAVEGSIDGLLPKAPDCMTTEIRRCSTVLQILEAPNAVYALAAFTFLHSTAKEMVFVFAVISNLDIWFEEAVYRRAPTFAESFCKRESVRKHNVGQKFTY
jgi:hypothetical protein